MNAIAAMIRETYAACTLENTLQIASRMANPVADLEGESTAGNGEEHSGIVSSNETSAMESTLRVYRKCVNCRLVQHGSM